MKQVKKSIAILLVLLLMLATITGCGKEKDKDKDKDDTTTTQTEVTATTTTTEETATAPENKHAGVWYEIFVRSFADSNNDGKGDFKGATQKLDYLEDLGVKGIWLMPINESPSYHQYDVSDYTTVDPDCGTMEDFKAFLDACHERDIEVIMDLVVNHTSSQHKWFKSAVADPNSEYRDYYIWSDGKTEGINYNDRWYKRGDSYYFAHFWDQMPDLNFDNPKVREEVKNIAKFWLDYGVDGFRMDAAMHIYTQNEKAAGTNLLGLNQTWWEEFDTFCKSVNEDYYLVGEVWDDSKTRSFYGKNFETLFNFDFGDNGSGIISMVKGGTDYKSSENGFIDMMDTTYKYYKRNASVEFVDAPFLTNHDQMRTMSYLNGDITQAKLAANIYLTLPGNPFIYYGEEIGMQGKKPDEAIREPLQWGDEYTTKWYSNTYNKETPTIKDQLEDKDSMLSHYKELIALRNDNEALTYGDFVGIKSGNRRVVTYSRNTEESTCIVIHNLSSESQTITFDKLGLSSDVEVIYSTDKEYKYTPAAELVLVPQSTLIFKQAK